MREQVIARLRPALEDQGWDGLVVSSPENFAYLAGFVVPSHPLMRWRHAAVVLPAGGDPAVMCVGVEEAMVRQRTGAAEVAVWDEFGDDPMACLAGLLERLGLSRGRLGVELGYLPAADFARLREAAPGVEWLAADRWLGRQRQVKTPQELDLLARLSRISDASIGTALGSVKAGDTEMEIAAALTDGIYRGGAEDFKLMIVATGPRSQLANVGPSERVLQEGDVCRIEIFAVAEGYHAGVCRTAVVGRPPPEAVGIWANLVECRDVLLDAIRPGVSSRSVWDRFEALCGPLGLPLFSFVGHGIGLSLHEHPYLSPRHDQVLEEGMVFGVEPLIYDTGHGFGLQLKDMVEVTPQGARLLSDVNDNRELIAVG
ncbi:MAG: Xaa-Pro peptidase family protein [bacterium]|nr:Xaa-Pro peptidase family protein [bacterium]MDE0600364.1 Xaa-Pro peptidase family protein [bacterium]